MDTRWFGMGDNPSAPLLIHGEKHEIAATHDHVYAATGAVSGAVSVGGPGEIDAAVDSARRALPGWRSLEPDARRNLLLSVADVLDRHAEELARLSVLDNGTPLTVARVFPGIAADYFRYNAGWADKLTGQVIPVWPGTQDVLDYTHPEPYGVVAVIIPWNAPLRAVSMTVAPALAAGNTVVLKPPEFTPYAAARFGQLLLEAGIPPGVVNVVTTDGPGSSLLVRHPGVDLVHFTGSTATGRLVMDGAKENLTPVVLELGGKSANLLFADAPNLDDAIDRALGSVVRLCGQSCISGTRLLVQRSIYDRVVETITSRAEAVVLGDPALDETQIGPIATRSSYVRILDMVSRAVEQGAGQLVAGGKRDESTGTDGFFLRPTVFADVRPESEIARDEIFGPVLSVMPFDQEQEAVQIANDSAYGLSAWVQTSDVGRAHRLARALEAGNVWINGGYSPASMIPFGGMKDSGFGRLGGEEGVKAFLQTKNVWLTLPGRPDSP